MVTTPLPTVLQAIYAKLQDDYPQCQINCGLYYGTQHNIEILYKNSIVADIYLCHTPHTLKITSYNYESGMSRHSHHDMCNPHLLTTIKTRIDGLLAAHDNLSTTPNSDTHPSHL